MQRTWIPKSKGEEKERNNKRNEQCNLALGAQKAKKQKENIKEIKDATWDLDPKKEMKKQQEHKRNGKCNLAPGAQKANKKKRNMKDMENTT